MAPAAIWIIPNPSNSISDHSRRIQIKITLSLTLCFFCNGHVGRPPLVHFSQLGTGGSVDVTTPSPANHSAEYPPLCFFVDIFQSKGSNISFWIFGLLLGFHYILNDLSLSHSIMRKCRVAYFQKPYYTHLLKYKIHKSNK